MAKAAKNEAKKDDTELMETTQEHEEFDVADLDPNTIVEVDLCDLRSAGRSVASRWGRVEFDKEGKATLKAKVSDLRLINSLGWLSVADQEKYLGLEAAQEPMVPASHSNAELEATKAANVALATRNADLEAQMAMMNKQFRAEAEKFTDNAHEKVKAMDDQLRVATTERDAARQELAAANAKLAQLAPAVTVEEKKSTKG